jgi:hypothetical protein
MTSRFLNPTGMAAPIGPIGTQERTKVELVDHVQHEPGQVVGRQPVAQVGRQQERAGRSRPEGSCRPWRILSLRGIHTKRELFLKCQRARPVLPLFALLTASLPLAVARTGRGAWMGLLVEPAAPGHQVTVGRRLQPGFGLGQVAAAATPSPFQVPLELLLVELLALGPGGLDPTQQLVVAATPGQVVADQRRRCSLQLRTVGAARCARPVAVKAVDPLIQHPELLDDPPDLGPCQIRLLAAELPVQVHGLLVAGEHPARVADHEHPHRIYQDPWDRQPRQVQPLEPIHHAQAAAVLDRREELVVAAQHGGLQRRQVLHRSPLVAHAISHLPVGRMVAHLGEGTDANPPPRQRRCIGHPAQVGRVRKRL